MDVCGGEVKRRQRKRRAHWEENESRDQELAISILSRVSRTESGSRGTSSGIKGVLPSPSCPSCPSWPRTVQGWRQAQGPDTLPALHPVKPPRGQHEFNILIKFHNKLITNHKEKIFLQKQIGQKTYHEFFEVNKKSDKVEFFYSGIVSLYTH